MIVPSIDLRGGQAVQLRQGKDHVLTAEQDPVELARTFNRYGPVAVVDLDAALGEGDNLELIQRICRVADVRVGGGIRDTARAEALLRAGARQLVIGTKAEPEFLEAFAPEHIIVALDHRGGVVVDEGWTRSTGETLEQRAARLADHCAGFLVTFVEDEGGLGGMPSDEVVRLRDALPRPITVAGGVADTAEATRLVELGVDVQVGMALYTGKLDLAEVVVGSLDFEKVGGLIPTIVQESSGQVLMLAYSSPESLSRALREGKGVYFSRSRDALWEKGATSGNTQRLLAARSDCDRDALLFTVEQTGPACHTGAHACFGPRAFSLGRLFHVLRDRLTNPPEGSYTARLFADRALLEAKIREEVEEVLSAPDRENLRWEVGDVLYFLSVLAAQEGWDWRDIEGELRARHGAR